VVFGGNQVPTVDDLKIPNPFVVRITLSNKETIEIPWDFARHYCDPTYAVRVEKQREAGQALIGRRIHRLRSALKLSLEGLARRAGINRMTLARLERGAMSPRHETLKALSQALGVGLTELLVDRQT
jgi:DNA-binding XRE family transcriptional regulator